MKSHRHRTPTGVIDYQELLGGLSADIVETFDGLELMGSYALGTHLFSEGQAPSGIFILHRGRATLSIADGAGAIFHSVGVVPGEITGVAAALSGAPYEATLEVTAPAEFGFVSTDNFERFLGAHADVALKLVQRLSRDLNTALARLRGLGELESSKRPSSPSRRPRRHC